MNNFNELKTALSKIRSVQQKLQRFGISVNDHGDITFELTKDISKTLSKSDFLEWDRLSLEERVSLALACAKKDKKVSFNQNDVDFINKFFGISITPYKINKIANQFI